MGHKEHVIGQHTAAVQLAAEQAGVQITERLYRGKSYPWKRSAVNKFVREEKYLVLK